MSVTCTCVDVKLYTLPWQQNVNPSELLYRRAIRLMAAYHRHGWWVPHIYSEKGILHIVIQWAPIKSLRSVYIQRSFYSVTVFQNTVGNFYYVSVVHTVYMVCGWLKYLNIYYSCTLCPMLFSPWYVLGLESMSHVCMFENQRYSWQVTDCRQTPPHQLILLGTNVPKRFFWFLDIYKH